MTNHPNPGQLGDSRGACNTRRLLAGIILLAACMMIPPAVADGQTSVPANTQPATQPGAAGPQAKTQPGAAGPQETAKTQPAKASLAEQIDQAISDLGAPEWKKREKAVRTLWSIGPQASSKLMEATRSKDPEVAARATEILEKFSAGIYPDTPKDVADMLMQLKAGKVQLDAVVAKLQSLGQAGYKTLAVIAPEEFRKTLRGVLAQEKFDSAREMLLSVSETGTDASLSDFAAISLLGGKLDEDIAHLLEKQPRSGPMEKCLAYLYRAKGDMKSALECARRSQDEAVVKALLMEQGNWKELATLESATTVLPGANQQAAQIEHLGRLAAYHRLAGNEKEFAAAIEQLAQFGKSNVNSTWMVAKALLINERPNEAIELMLNAKQFGEAVSLLMQASRQDEALTTLGKLPAQGTELTLARIYSQLGNRTLAQGCFNQATNQFNGQSEVVRLIALQEYQFGFKQEFLNQIDQLADWGGGGQQTDMSDILGPVLNQPEAAVRIWAGLLRKDPNEAASETVKRVLALYDPQSPKAAVDAAVAALEKVTDPKNAASVAGNAEAIASLYQAFGRMDETLKYYRKAAEVVHPADQLEPAQTWFNRRMRVGDLLAQRGKWDEAAHFYGEASKITPDKEPAPNGQPPIPGRPGVLRPAGVTEIVPQLTGPEVWTALYLYGQALTKSGKEEQGRKLMSQASMKYLGDPNARLALVWALEARKLHDEAARQLDLLARTTELDSLTWYNMRSAAARLLSLKKDYAGSALARQQYQLCCLSPATEKTQVEGYLTDASVARADMMRAAIAAGKFDDAIANLKQAQALLPQDTNAVIDMVSALDHAGKKAQADAVFNDAYKHAAAQVAKYPKSGNLNNAAAWLCARCRRQLEAGLKCALAAVDAEKDSPGVMDTLAEAYFQSGQRDKAVEWMTKALKYKPQWDYLQKQLARMKTGKPEDPVPESTEQP